MKKFKINYRRALQLGVAIAPMTVALAVVSCNGDDAAFDPKGKDDVYDVGMTLGYAPYDFLITKAQRDKIMAGGLDGSHAKTDADLLALEKKMVAAADNDRFAAGLDVYIAKELAAKLKDKDGHKMYTSLALHQYSPAGLQQALKNKDYEAMIAGMSKTEKRDKVFDFSDTYYAATDGFLLHKAQTFKSVEDLKKSSETEIIAIKGTLQEKAAKEYFGATRVKSVDNDINAMEEFKTTAKSVYLIENIVGENSKHGQVANYKFLKEDGKGEAKFDFTGFPEIPGGSNIVMHDGAQKFINTTLNPTLSTILKNDTFKEKLMTAAIDIYDHLG